MPPPEHLPTLLAWRLGIPLLDVCSSAQPTTILRRYSFGTAVAGHTSHKRTYDPLQDPRSSTGRPIISVLTKIQFSPHRCAPHANIMLCIYSPSLEKGRQGKTPELTLTRPRSNIRTHASQLPTPSSATSIFAGLPLIAVGDLTYVCSSYSPPPSAFMNRSAHSRGFPSQFIFGPTKSLALAAS